MGRPSGGPENSQEEEVGHEEDDVEDESEDCEGEELHDLDRPDTMLTASALGPQVPRNLPRVEDFVSTQR